MNWQTNFIDNVNEALVDAQDAKGAGVKITVSSDMAENSWFSCRTPHPSGRSGGTTRHTIIKVERFC